MSQLTNRELAAVQAAGLIHDAEMAIDVALAAVAAIVQRMPSLIREAGVTPGYGQAAVGRFSAAVAQIAEARGTVGDGHRSIEAVARRLGVSHVVAQAMPKDSHDEGTVPGLLRTLRPEVA